MFHLSTKLVQCPTSGLRQSGRWSTDKNGMNEKSGANTSWLEEIGGRVYTLSLAESVAATSSSAEKGGVCTSSLVVNSWVRAPSTTLLVPSGWPKEEPLSISWGAATLFSVSIVICPKPVILQGLFVVRTYKHSKIFQFKNFSEECVGEITYGWWSKTKDMEEEEHTTKWACTTANSLLTEWPCARARADLVTRSMWGTAGHR